MKEEVKLLKKWIKIMNEIDSFINDNNLYATLIEVKDYNGFRRIKNIFELRLEAEKRRIRK